MKNLQEVQFYLADCYLCGEHTECTATIMGDHICDMCRVLGNSEED